MKKVCIVGCGDGGIMLANRLIKNKEFEITLIDSQTMHYFQPWQLHMAFEGKKEKSIEKRKLLPSKEKLIIKKAKEVDLDNRHIKLEDDTKLQYDFVVIDTGSRGDYNKIPGHKALHDRFGDFHSGSEEASKLWNNVKAFKGGNVIIGPTYPIYKCPPSPVEAALMFEEYANNKRIREKTNITFITPFPRPYPAEPMNEIVEPIMKSRKIEIATFYDVEEIDIKNQTIKSIEGDALKYDLAALVPPHAGSNIVKDYCDDDGFVKTNKETLLIGDYDDAYCIGDATNIQTSKSGVTVHLESKVVAQRLNGEDAKFNGRTHCPLEVGYSKATFVIGSYTEPVVKLKPSRFNYFMKMNMKYFAWQTLKGKMDWFIDSYFDTTNPHKLNSKINNPKAQN